jgi:hypothetical protein
MHQDWNNLNYLMQSHLLCFDSQPMMLCVCCVIGAALALLLAPLLLLLLPLFLLLLPLDSEVGL